jgi:hypothetical protein
VDDVEGFTYIGSVVTTTGGTHDEVTTRVRKENTASIRLHPAWKAKEISTKTKMKIFSSNIKYVCTTV